MSQLSEVDNSNIINIDRFDKLKEESFKLIPDPSVYSTIKNKPLTNLCFLR